jgi:hypothetical protein
MRQQAMLILGTTILLPKILSTIDPRFIIPQWVAIFLGGYVLFSAINIRCFLKNWAKTHRPRQNATGNFAAVPAVTDAFEGLPFMAEGYEFNENSGAIICDSSDIAAVKVYPKALNQLNVTVIYKSASRIATFIKWIDDLDD